MTVDQKAQVANAREEQQMSNENDEQNRAEVDLRTPDVWCVELGVQILDADGWRGRDGRDWADPISLAEFQQRLATCTQRSTAPRDQHQKWADPQGLIVGTQPAQPAGYKLGNAVAKVVAEHTGLKAHRIVELHINADSIWIVYGVRTGRDLEDIVTRTRRIDPETGDMISDRDGRF